VAGLFSFLIMAAFGAIFVVGRRSGLALVNHRRPQGKPPSDGSGRIGNRWSSAGTSGHTRRMEFAAPGTAAGSSA
jgi:hypothetical protein